METVMKMKKVQEAVIDNVRINIAISLEDETATMIATGTCPECGGYGCNNHNMNNKDCSAGRVSIYLDPTKLGDNLDIADANKIKDIIRYLAGQMN